MKFLIPFFSKTIRNLQQSISFPKYVLQNGEKFTIKESLGKIRGAYFIIYPILKM
jgi:hypothetical protein